MSRATVPPADTALAVRQLETLPEFATLANLRHATASEELDLCRAVIDEAARFASERLNPLNVQGDETGCRIVDGRVRTAPLHPHTWRAFCDGGWPSINLPAAVGGQGLPLLLTIAVQELFDRHCPAFGMLMVPTRSAAVLLGAFAEDAIQAEWLPQLASGAWGGTICISEDGAGSDVQRLRTTATLIDGEWRITGEKQWISFGDHDLTDRIGHCVLARTTDRPGISLFLVPDQINGMRNGVTPRRIEEKLGLHASPTCAVGFEEARGWLVGTEGRGLAQMFVMITRMRLAVGAMGLGIAAGALDVAKRFVEERRQGGAIGTPAIAIAEHADIQRQILSMVARVDLLRGLIFTLAAKADLAEGGGESEKEDAALVAWLLPIAKTLGGEVAFSVASDAIQVLGGSGYTRDWPVEQALRDARVLTVFEGTTGIQALDLLHRRLWRDGGTGLRIFCATAIADSADHAAASARRTVELLQQAATHLDGLRGVPARAEAVATPFLELAGLAALGWIAARNLTIAGTDAASARLRAGARYWLADLEARAGAVHAAIVRDFDLAQAFASVRSVTK